MRERWDLPELPSAGTVAAAALSLFVVCFAVYGPALQNSFVRFDDGMLIFENPIARGVTIENVQGAFTTYDPELYIPLTLLGYQIDYEIGGIDPFPYHVHRLLLHALNAALVAWLVFLLSSSGRAGMIAGLFWAIHPLNTEAVAWASALKDVQATSFFLGSIIAYLSYRSSGRRALYWLAATFALLGFLSKVIVITLPAVLLLLDWRYDRRLSAKGLLELWPFFLLSIIFGAVALGGKTDIIAETTLADILLVIPKSTMFYLQKLPWPADLSVLYPIDGTISLASPAFFLPIAALALLVGSALYAGRFSRDIPFAVFFFLVTLAPTFTNLSKAGITYMASDRYAYIPSIGLFFLAAVAVDRLLSLPGRRSQVRSRTIAASTVGLAAFLLLSRTAAAQSLVWRNTESLFQNVLRLYPDSFVARNNLGNAYLRQQRWDDAIREYEEGLRHEQNVTLHNNLARAYGKKGLVANAAEQFEKSLALEPRNHETYVEFGRMYAENGRIPEALDAYGTAIDLVPGYAVVYVNRGSLLVNEGRIDEAVADLKKAIDLDPNVPQAYYNLGIVRSLQDDADEAIRLYESAVELQPAFYEAHFNLGRLYAKVGRLVEARAEMAAALRIKPGNKTIEGAIRQIDEALAAQRARR